MAQPPLQNSFRTDGRVNQDPKLLLMGQASKPSLNLLLGRSTVRRLRGVRQTCHPDNQRSVVVVHSPSSVCVQSGATFSSFLRVAGGAFTAFGSRSNQPSPSRKNCLLSLPPARAEERSNHRNSEGLSKKRRRRKWWTIFCCELLGVFFGRASGRGATTNRPPCRKTQKWVRKRRRSRFFLL